MRIDWNDDGTPIYKRVSGESLDAVHDAIVSAYVSSGRISQFLEQRPVAANGLQQPHSKILFKDYVMQWFELYKTGVKATTKADYLYIIRRYLIPAFGDKHLYEVTTADIQTLFNQWKSIAKSSINKMEIVLSQVFRSALKDKLILENPVDRERLVNPSKVVNSRDALTEAEFMDVLDNIRKLDGSDRYLLALLALTGMRRGEVLGLRWEDIDFDSNLISVQRNVVFTDNSPMLDTLKSKSGYRKIPLDERLATHLTPRQASGFVVGGDKPITKSSYVKTMRRIGQKVDLHGASAHIFRHTYATMLKNAGVDFKTIQSILGHSDISTTMNIYAHNSDDNLHIANRLFVDHLTKTSADI